MLIEFRDVRQVEGEGPRRWFFDDYFDLIVWYLEAGGIDGWLLYHFRDQNPIALSVAGLERRRAFSRSSAACSPPILPSAVMAAAASVLSLLRTSLANCGTAFASPL